MRKVNAGTLSALVAGLSQDSGISVSVGSQWSFDPSKLHLTVSEEDMKNKGTAFCAAITAHEIGHYFISRYHMFNFGDANNPLICHMLNGLEDPKSNLWIQARYPGTASWFKKMHVRDRRTLMNLDEGKFFPRTLRYCQLCSIEDNFLVNKNDLSKAAAPEVLDALDSTRNARRRYMTEFPSPDLLVGNRVKVETEYRVSVEPSIAKGQYADLPFSDDRAFLEMAVRTSSYRSFRIAMDDIRPVIMQLYEIDIDTIADYITESVSDTIDYISDAVVSRREGVIAILIREAFLSSSQTPKTGSHVESTNSLAKSAYDIFLGIGFSQNREARISIPAGIRNFTDIMDGVEPVKVHASLIPGGMCAPSTLRKMMRDQPKELQDTPQDNFDELDSVVSSQVTQLVKNIEDILIPRKRMRRRSGYPSGQKINLRQAFAFEADRSQYNKLWDRLTVPDRHGMAVSLLVDLSGSMEGKKAEGAYMAALLLADTLSRLNINFSVNGFQDKLIPFLAFGQRYSEESRSGLRGLILECYGQRKGGNNMYLYNDDGPCLAQAADELVECTSAYDKLLIIISDGLPAGSRSNEDDLKEVIRGISKTSVVTLVGLGLGDETEHVSDYYENAEANIPTNELATRIGAVLKKAILGQSGVVHTPVSK